MNIEDLKQIVTRQDLRELESSLLSQIKEIISGVNDKEFYTPKEFATKTSMSYTNVIRYCQEGMIKARQDNRGGVWIIHHSEINRLVQEARNNMICKD